MGVIEMSVTKVIEEILDKKNISKADFAESIGITKQNLGNKFKRDNFSALELVEMADALGMQLVLRKQGKELKAEEYLLDYPEEQKDHQGFSRKLKADLFIDDRNLGGLPDWGVIYEMVKEKKTFADIYSQNEEDTAPLKKKKRWFSF